MLNLSNKKEVNQEVEVVLLVILEAEVIVAT